MDEIYNDRLHQLNYLEFIETLARYSEIGYEICLNRIKNPLYKLDPIKII